MNKFYYTITYKRKSDNKNKVWDILPLDNSLDLALKQLKNMASSFDWDIVCWINDLDFLKIIEKNYLYSKWNEYYFNKLPIESIEWINESDTAFMSVSEQASIYWIKDDDLLKPYIKDVTNILLNKYKIYWNDYEKMWKVLFNNNILEVNTHIFKLDEDKKINELFDLLFRAKAYYWKLNFSYDELKDLIKNNIYKKLKREHINNLSINDIVLKKLKLIKTKTKMKYNILNISPSKISIWQESATN